MIRHVFMISDGTGLTVESFSNSLLTQFEHLHFEKQIIPYVDTLEKAQAIIPKINDVYDSTGHKALVFMTLVNPTLCDSIKQSNACVFDLFNTFLDPLEHALQTTASDTVGRAHSLTDGLIYERRIQAINYALSSDDGIKISEYDQADIILIGVSRSGKTPTCLYMALQFGVFAANYPFTDEDLSDGRLPTLLRPYKNKLFGLTINPDRLQSIRTERCPNSRYASSKQCQAEVAEVEAMYRYENIPFINSTHFSIEEIATRVMSIFKIKRRI